MLSNRGFSGEKQEFQGIHKPKAVRVGPLPFSITGVVGRNVFLAVFSHSAGIARAFKAAVAGFSETESVMQELWLATSRHWICEQDS
jgi:hypothetical protein